MANTTLPEPDYNDLLLELSQFNTSAPSSPALPFFELCPISTWNQLRAPGPAINPYFSPAVPPCSNFSPTSTTPSYSSLTWPFQFHYSTLLQPSSLQLLQLYCSILLQPLTWPLQFHYSTLLQPSPLCHPTTLQLHYSDLLQLPLPVGISKPRGCSLQLKVTKR